ncbi:MAG: O-antigen ligase family protein [bacterium]|nr:O-antigen ligase family protein [bacterium]
MIERLIWLVPLAVAAFGAWRPKAGLVALTAALPLFGSPPGGPYLGALDAAALAAIVTAWRAGRARPSPLTWPAIAFVAVSLLSLIPSPYLPPSWHPSILLGVLRALPGVESSNALYTWRAAVNLVIGLGLFFAVRRAFRASSIRPLAWSLLGGLTLLSLLGFASQAGAVDLGGYRRFVTDETGSRRLHSLFFLAGWLAEYIVIAAPLALAALSRMNADLRLRLGGVFLAIMAASLVLCQQRGAWIAAFAQVVFAIAIVVPRLGDRRLQMRRVALVGAASLLIAGTVVVATSDSLEGLRGRAGSLRSGFSARLPLWSAALEMVEQRPLLGWGVGSYAPAFDNLHPPGSPGARRNRGSAHSLYLGVAAESGLLGLGGLALLALSAALCLARPGPGSRGFAVALAASLVGVTVYGLVQHLFYLQNIAYLLWLLLGCVALVTERSENGTVERLARGLIILAIVLVPLRLVFTEAPRYRGNRSFGWHAREGSPSNTFRWTADRALYGLRWKGSTLVLSLANGHPLGARRPVSVTISADSKTVAELTVAGEWEEHRLELGQPQAEWLVLALEAEPAFRPFSDYRRYPELAPSRDIRLLGVAVRDLHWDASTTEN